MDGGAGRGGDATDVDAFAAVPGDELVVVGLVAGVAHRPQRELLVRRPGQAGPLLDGGTVGGGGTVDVEARPSATARPTPAPAPVTMAMPLATGDLGAAARRPRSPTVARATTRCP